MRQPGPRHPALCSAWRRAGTSQFISLQLMSLPVVIVVTPSSLQFPEHAGKLPLGGLAGLGAVITLTQNKGVARVVDDLLGRSI